MRPRDTPLRSLKRREETMSKRIVKIIDIRFHDPGRHSAAGRTPAHCAVLSRAAAAACGFVARADLDG
jgi:hypothetical protein